MCHVCDRAFASLRELDQRLLELEYRVRIDGTDPYLREARNSVRKQIKRGEEDALRLVRSLHGKQHPGTPSRSIEPDETQLELL